MRIISRARLQESWSAEKRFADAEPPLRRWHAITSHAAWKSFADVKLTFGKNVDQVTVRSRRPVCVFNVHGNKYRLVAAVHYLARHHEKGRVYVLGIMPHDEYDLDKWKSEL